MGEGGREERKEGRKKRKGRRERGGSNLQIQSSASMSTHILKMR